jgi:hypothetical protein
MAFWRPDQCLSWSYFMQIFVHNLEKSKDNGIYDCSRVWLAICHEQAPRLILDLYPKTFFGEKNSDFVNEMCFVLCFLKKFLSKAF